MTRGTAQAAPGYQPQRSPLEEFGDLALVSVEGTGSYGAGLARYLAARGVRVVEVDRADRQERHRNGKSGPPDAVSAARAALSSGSALRFEVADFRCRCWRERKPFAGRVGPGSQ